MKTKNGIELNLKESNYTYNYKGFLFYFSSEFYKQKFIEKINSYINEEQLKINAKYQVKIDLEMFFAIALYRKIEKRGFYVTVGSIKLTNDFYFIAYFKNKIM